MFIWLCPPFHRFLPSATTSPHRIPNTAAARPAPALPRRIDRCNCSSLTLIRLLFFNAGGRMGVGGGRAWQVLHPITGALAGWHVALNNNMLDQGEGAHRSSVGVGTCGEGTREHRLRVPPPPPDASVMCCIATMP